jgi:hypothetical protein
MTVFTYRIGSSFLPGDVAPKKEVLQGLHLILNDGNTSDNERKWRLTKNWLLYGPKEGVLSVINRSGVLIKLEKPTVSTKE